jgi:threonine dehydratase
LKTEIVGVVAEAAPAYAESFLAHAPVSRPVGATVAEGMACRIPNAESLDVILSNVARIVTVGEGEIRSAMRALYTDTHNVAEGAGAAALAAAMKERSSIQGQRVAVVLTGGNIDKSVFAEVLAESD